MKRVYPFIYAVFAGLAIAVGGTVLLSQESPIVGALFFTVGLFMILTLGLNLFTGKVCYIFEKDKDFVINVPIIWVGNIIGAWLGAVMIRATRVAPALIEKAEGIVDKKLNDDLLSIFILAFFCNMLIFMAVDNFNNNKHELGKYMAMIAVPAFIFAGFEHCVANMYYFAMADVLWNPTSMLYILVMTLGNSVGGLVIPVVRMYKNKFESSTTTV